MAVLKYHALDRRDHEIKGKRSSPHSPPIAPVLSDMQSSMISPVTPVLSDLQNSMNQERPPFRPKKRTCTAFGSIVVCKCSSLTFVASCHRHGASMDVWQMPNVSDAKENEPPFQIAHSDWCPAKPIIAALPNVRSESFDFDAEISALTDEIAGQVITLRYSLEEELHKDAARANKLSETNVSEAKMSEATIVEANKVSEASVARLLEFATTASHESGEDEFAMRVLEDQFAVRVLTRLSHSEASHLEQNLLRTFSQPRLRIPISQV